MWLCTQHGFYSIVRKNEREVHIRARCKEDLENLRRICTGVVGTAASWNIHRTEPADYLWRIVIPPSMLPDVLFTLAEQLDYSNFKGVVAALPDQRAKLGIYTAFHHDLEDWQNSK